ncbi:MAG: cupin domain-containing protein [Burkholderiales bacterium]
MHVKQQIIESGGGPSYDWANDHICVKTTCDHADGRVTMVEDALKPGFHLARHHHKKMTEVFYVLEGQVTFKFDDERVVASRGMTINIPPNVAHEVVSKAGARLITVFSPGGFDKYLKEMAAMTEAQFADEALMRTLAEKYDTWMM